MTKNDDKKIASTVECPQCHAPLMPTLREKGVTFKCRDKDCNYSRFEVWNK